MLVAALCTLAGVVVLLSLARWQADRAIWKEGLIAELSQRLAAPAVNLPGPNSWRDLRADTSEFVRVTFLAEFEPGQEALVYTTGSSVRPDVRGVGYWVLSPARLPGGGVVVVNRGFVPQGRENIEDIKGTPRGLARIVGVMRWPEVPSVFTPDGDLPRNLWFARDHGAIAKAKGWGEVAAFYIEQEAPAAPSGLPQVGTLVPDLPNNHRQYEITWVGLAIVLVAVFGVFFQRWYRREGQGAGH
jgi:surfeit locus 1 family protein